MTDARPEAEHTRIPPLGWILGYGPIVPMVVAAGMMAGAPAPWSTLAGMAATRWGAAILAFVAGVRRGTSFYTPGGPAIVELASALGFFAIAFVAMIAPERWAFGLLAIGYLAIATADARAARKGYVPRYFSHLRPSQMTMASVSFLVMVLVKA